MPAQPAVFLDRDGVINSLIYHQDVGVIDSPFTVQQFQLLPRVPRAIRLLNSLNIPVIVVSNQPGIAKRHFSLATLRKFDKKLKSILALAGGGIDGIYYCLHHPEAKKAILRKRCACRKPEIGMLTRAARDFGVDLSRSYMVGDGLTDIEAGSRAGCRTVFVGKWKCENCQFIRPACLKPDLTVRSLYEAAQIIQSEIASTLKKASRSAKYKQAASAV